jgi:hypothetical protein
MMFFWVSCHVDWLLKASVSEKHAVFIFRVEGLQSTWQFNPKNIIRIVIAMKILNIVNNSGRSKLLAQRD